MKDSIVAPPFITTRLPKGNLSRLWGTLLPKNINSASTQIQTGFFPATLDNSPIPQAHLPASNIYTTQSAKDSHAISEHEAPNWVMKEVGQNRLLLPNHITAIVLTGSSVFICLSYLLKGSVMCRCTFLNLLTFLQQKRAFRAGKL